MIEPEIWMNVTIMNHSMSMKCFCVQTVRSMHNDNISKLVL